MATNTPAIICTHCAQLVVPTCSGCRRPCRIYGTVNGLGIYLRSECCRKAAMHAAGRDPRDDLAVMTVLRPAAARDNADRLAGKLRRLQSQLADLDGPPGPRQFGEPLPRRREDLVADIAQAQELHERWAAAAASCTAEQPAA